MARILQQVKDSLVQAQDLKVLIDLLNKDKNVKDVCKDIADAEATLAEANDLRSKANAADSLVKEYTEKKADVDAVKAYLDTENEKLQKAQKQLAADQAALNKAQSVTENAKADYEAKAALSVATQAKLNDSLASAQQKEADLVRKNLELDTSIKNYNDKLEALKTVK